MWNSLENQSESLVSSSYRTTSLNLDANPKSYWHQLIPQLIHRSSEPSTDSSTSQKEINSYQRATNSLSSAVFKAVQKTRSIRRRVYEGIATTTIGQIDPFTNQVFNIRSVQTSVKAVIRKPRSAGGVTETNPFSLTFASSSAESSSGKEGAFSMFSALPFNFRGGFLVQYWNLQFQGQQFTGQLVNTGEQFSLATNLMNINESVPAYPPGYITSPSQLLMGNQTTIAGRRTASQFQVRLQGSGTGLLGGSYVFVVEAILARTV